MSAFIVRSGGLSGLRGLDVAPLIRLAARIQLFLFCIVVSISAFLLCDQASASVSVPGPSATLYSLPFYVCTHHYYVSATGSDNHVGTKVSPWLTIQRASSGRVAGDCVNVAPGTYSGSILTEYGGNAPTPAGYVVYRCEALDECHVLATQKGHLWGIKNPANFVVIDGFEIDGNDAAQANGIADACVASDGDTYGTANASHHLWILNNIIHHCNLAGISTGNTEWIYAIHNTVYHNSWTSGYQGSGIGLVVTQCIEAGNANCFLPGSKSYAGGKGTYKPSGMDLTYASPFHVLVEYNDVYENQIAAPPAGTVACGLHTDGNGIILDTWLDEATLKLVFPYKSLVMGNLSHSNGGRGIHVFNASNVIVANNTVFGNNTDICDPAYAIGDLSQQGGTNNRWINNIARSVNTNNNPAVCQAANPTNAAYCGGSNYPLLAGNGTHIIDKDNSYQNNILYESGPLPLYGDFGSGQAAVFNSDANSWNCSNNKCNIAPLLVVPGANFSLSNGSPAINYGLTAPYLPSSSIWAGACGPFLSACPQAPDPN